LGNNLFQTLGKSLHKGTLRIKRLKVRTRIHKRPPEFWTMLPRTDLNL
jgi:hypothetical protein